MTDHLDVVEFQRRLFNNVKGAALNAPRASGPTPEGLRTLLANRQALVNEYGEDLVRAMTKELKSLTNDALAVWDEALGEGPPDQRDKNDE